MSGHNIYYITCIPWSEHWAEQKQQQQQKNEITMLKYIVLVGRLFLSTFPHYENAWNRMWNNKINQKLSPCTLHKWKTTTTLSEAFQSCVLGFLTTADKLLHFAYYTQFSLFLPFFLFLSLFYDAWPISYTVKGFGENFICKRIAVNSKYHEKSHDPSNIWWVGGYNWKFSQKLSAKNTNTEKQSNYSALNKLHSMF